MTRELVNISEAARRVGRSRSTISAWINGDNPRLFAVGMDHDGTDLYDLAKVRAVASATPQRRRKRVRRA